MNNVIKINQQNFNISSDFLNSTYMVLNTCESITFNFNVIIDMSIYFIIDSNYINETIKIIYRNIEYLVSTKSDFNLVFLNSNLMIENVNKVQTIVPFSTKMSLICKNTNESQGFEPNTITKMESNWLDVESINNELYQINFSDNNYKFIGNFDEFTFININLQISFTIIWSGSLSGTQIFKLNLCRVVDNSIIRSLNFRKSRGGNLIENQLINANFLTFLKGEFDAFNLDGFYFSIDTELCDTLKISGADSTYRVLIFNDKIR